MRSDQLSLAARLDHWSGQSGDHRRLVAIVHAMAEAGIRLSGVIAVAALENPGADTKPEAVTNASGDEQKPLDVYAEKVVVDALGGLDIAAICSEESEEPIPVTAGGAYVVAVDPVDGSSNIDVNAPIGTIFAVLPSLGPDADPAAALLQPGRSQLAAGMIIYGPATILVLTLGAGTDIYILDPRTRYFRLVREGIQLPADSSEYAINASNARHWGVGISEYIGDLVSGKEGPRERSFNMRWLASLVAEAYRILTRGGIFLYPADDRAGYENGRIRLVYEANPIGFLIEQAGGAATNGTEEILDLVPSELHQRVPFIFGNRTKVERVRRYLSDPNLRAAHSPLFSSRGLFRDQTNT
ncbi:class 1 fructose-bisphosphatase [Propionicimonas sp.]|uniref:class 1 fructose-bisphosphatase n=1 Tax=Propionicimonas sp. TaxID=1955623 RepID=UPI001797820C|nr:class 1 fructose-bisphosphatase [Propionicimonas sp.]MBU3976680.1 class 1 fructose-bisphosphatase [Actinomycetota bacterium]MBA3019746.1 class 1 fructose-bisphosphatase [Propionicimonas sp.]MBU3986775.1 class 1 fructose-bisphosphatase [Actinomycetota bacterium]MBU4006687.1 class 1 fructose-bisphosphatase [Actinomycetota bacterium]MBU4065387.1 class 1 fructose-bisphosphatase [Actinomycetota bacterium]